jgi:hypothetical protein
MAERVKGDESATPPVQGAGADINETPQEEVGLDDRLNVIFKALSDLQSAVKDLATVVSAGEEAQRGYEETLNQVKADLAKMDVGFRAASAENKAGDKMMALAGTPTVSPGAEGVTTTNVMEPAEHLYKKETDVVKSASSVPPVVTPRPDVEVGKGLLNDPSADLIKNILVGKIKPGEASRQAFKLTRGG